MQVRASGVCARFPLVIRACWCWRGGVVSAAQARGLPGGRPYLLQDVRVCLLEVVEGLAESARSPGHARSPRTPTTQEYEETYSP